MGISALGAGITAGLGASFNSAGGFATAANLAAKGSNTAAAINAAVNSVATQGVMVASGLQDKFSWKSVAASAIGAAIGNQIGASIGSSSLAEKNPDFARLATSVTRGVTGAIVRHGITGDDIDYSQVAADSFGNAIADEIVGQLRQPQMAETSAAIAKKDEAQSLPSRLLKYPPAQAQGHARGIGFF